MHIKRDTGGFVLLEVIAAAFVFALTILGLSASLANGARLAEGSREEMLARNALRSMSARIAAMPFDQVALAHHGRGFPVGTLQPVEDDPDGFAGEIVFEDGPAPQLYRVVLTVRWKGAGGPREVQSVHMLANVRGDTELAPTMTEVVEAQAGRELLPLQDPLQEPVAGDS